MYHFICTQWIALMSERTNQGELLAQPYPIQRCNCPLFFCFWQSFSGHRGPISCLAFGPDSSELFSGSFDRSIMQWNAEDRTYMNCLYGHQNEILTMDALNKDRLLTVARDRTMHLWKVTIYVYRVS
jgi:WD40 repeat protein